MGTGRFGKIVKTIFLLLLFVTAFTACTAKQEENTAEVFNLSETAGVSESADSTTADDKSLDDIDNPTNKILIAYFTRHGISAGSEDDDADAVTSASLTIGNAFLAAQAVQDETGGELFQIRTVMEYPKDYDETHDVARRQMIDGERPELAEHVEDMEQYDTVVLVFPNWWGTLPMPVYTFLESYDFSGKTVLPLCVSGGGGFGKSLNDLNNAIPDADIGEGLNIPESEIDKAQEKIRDWIEDSGISQTVETVGLSESEVQEISVLRDGKMIYGRVYLPAGKSPFPVVIIAHGFNNNISFTTGYAEAFQKAGIAACVFDFIGGGYGSKSDGSMSEMSVLTEAADMNAVIDTVCAMDNIDDNSLFLMGLSQGGFVATYVAGTRSQDIQGLIAFYPAYVLQDDARERIAGLSEIPEMTTLMGATIGRVYTEDALSFDIYEVMKNYTGNALIVHGTADNIVPVSYSERAAVTMEAAVLLKIEGAGHGFYGKDDLTATEAAINFIN